MARRMRWEKCDASRRTCSETIAGRCYSRGSCIEFTIYNKIEARSREIVCEQELVKSRLRVNAANVSVRNCLVTVCVWLSSSWDLRLSADKVADHEQQAAGNRVQGGSDVVIPISTTPETLRMGRGAVVNSSKARFVAGPSIVVAIF